MIKPTTSPAAPTTPSTAFCGACWHHPTRKHHIAPAEGAGHCPGCAVAWDNAALVYARLQKKKGKKGKSWVATTVLNTPPSNTPTSSTTSSRLWADTVRGAGSREQRDDTTDGSQTSEEIASPNMASPEYDSSYESNASPMDSPRTSDDAGLNNETWLRQTLEQRERAQLPAPTPLAAPLPVHVPDSTATIEQPSYPTPLPAPLAAPTPATLPAPLRVHISSTATIGKPSSAPSLSKHGDASAMCATSDTWSPWASRPVVLCPWMPLEVQKQDKTQKSQQQQQWQEQQQRLYQLDQQEQQQLQQQYRQEQQEQLRRRQQEQQRKQAMEQQQLMQQQQLIQQQQWFQQQQLAQQQHQAYNQYMESTAKTKFAQPQPHAQPTLVKFPLHPTQYSTIMQSYGQAPHPVACC